jgi:NifU-like protein
MEDGCGMWDYSEKVREHFLNPHNVGEVKEPDGVGEVGNIKCGDALKLTFKLDRQGRIEDIKFRTFGCGSAIASSSVLTDLCKGRTLAEAERITNKDIADALGGLPPAKMHCSVMGQEALAAAIAYYRSAGRTTQPPGKEGRLICTCFQVTEPEIERAIRGNHLTTVEEVTHYTKAGGGCGGCQDEIQRILDRVNGNAPRAAAVPAAPRMTNLQKIERIKEVLTAEVAPVLARDGGGVELVDVDGNDVYVRFTGHCAGCMFARQTQYSVVQDTLRKKVRPELVVKEG